MQILIVGAGIFGATAALELSRRSHHVTLLDPGPLPHPLAASTDISKAIRLEYGSDEFYASLMEEALDGWRSWNRAWGETLFHETGVMFLRSSPPAPGDFEYESLLLLQRRGHPVRAVTAQEIAARFPAWNADRYRWGIHDPQGGFAESSKVVSRVVNEARRQGVAMVVGQFRALREGGAGVTLHDGRELPADQVVLAAGAWTPHLLPELAPLFRTAGLPVFHLCPPDPDLFLAERFPGFGADISTTGYYGFPVHQGVVKIANHGEGRLMRPQSPDRHVTEAETADLRTFLTGAFPALSDAPIVSTRVCLYCDTPDGDFWIDRHPTMPSLVVATGGSGHAFKFAPVLGSLIANAVEDRVTPAGARFRWRTPVARAEAARKRSPSANPDAS